MVGLARGGLVRRSQAFQTKGIGPFLLDLWRTDTRSPIKPMRGLAASSLKHWSIAGVRFMDRWQAHVPASPFAMSGETEQAINQDEEQPHQTAPRWATQGSRSAFGKTLASGDVLRIVDQIVVAWSNASIRVRATASSKPKS